MRTSKATQELILWNYRHNVAQARSKKLKQFAEEQLAQYERELAKRRQPKKDNPFTRFEQALAQHTNKP